MSSSVSLLNPQRRVLRLGAVAFGSSSLATAAAPQSVAVQDWIAHLQQNGFTASVIDKGYVIEGHVPAADIRRLLKEKPQALGLAVPAMPNGAPGIDGQAYGGRRDPYKVLLIQKDGSVDVFNSYP